jgi:hypothetical protein
MSSFSPSDAAFEGFRLTRERPRTVLAWALCYLVFSYLIGAVADLTLGAQSQSLLADLKRASADPTAFWPAVQKMAPFFLAGLPLSVAFQAIFTCAVYRAILRPEESARGYLRLGLDELRMMVLNLVLGVIWGATVFTVLLVALLAAAAAGTANESITVLIGDILTVGVFCAAVTVLTRLSLAGPMTFAERRLRVFASWSLSKGVFWRLFGAYTLSFALGAIVLLLMLLIVGLVLNILMQVTGMPITTLSAATSNPLAVGVGLISQVLTVLILTCFYVVLKAPPAQAYKGLMGGLAALPTPSTEPRS